MKKLNLIKAMSAVGILGVSAVAITTALTSCSRGTGENTLATFTSPEQFEDFFTSNRKIYEATGTSITPSSSPEDVLNYFVGGNRLWGYNLFYNQLKNYVGTINNGNPMVLKFTNITGKSGSVEFIKDIWIGEDRGTNYILKKGTLMSYELLDNVTCRINNMFYQTKVTEDDKGNYVEEEEKEFKRGSYQADKANIEIKGSESGFTLNLGATTEPTIGIASWYLLLDCYKDVSAT